MKFRYVILLLVFVIGLMCYHNIIGVAGNHNLINYWKLSEDGIEVQGTVNQLMPSYHQAIIYRYRVEDKDFEGRGVAGFGTPHFESIRPGDFYIGYLLAGGSFHKRIGQGQRTI